MEAVNSDADFLRRHAAQIASRFHHAAKILLTASPVWTLMTTAVDRAAEQDRYGVASTHARYPGIYRIYHSPPERRKCVEGRRSPEVGGRSEPPTMSRYRGPLPARQVQRLRSAPMKRYPITSDQKRQLDEDLTKVDDRLQEIIILMRATYGEESQPVIRAEETAAALQRLKWVLERTQQRRQAAR